MTWSTNLQGFGVNEAHREIANKRAITTRLQDRLSLMNRSWRRYPTRWREAPRDGGVNCHFKELPQSFEEGLDLLRT